jgi:hypothetical protein
LGGSIREEVLREPILQMEVRIAQDHAELGHGIETPLQLGDGLGVRFLFVDGINESY